MNFVQAVISGFKNYARAGGRASRSEFWYWQLFTVLIDFNAVIFDKLIARTPFGVSHPELFPHGHDHHGICYIVFSLGIFLPSLCVQIRRLHDVGRKGKWIFIGLTIIGMIYPLLVWNCRKGTTGSNLFGPDPLARDERQEKSHAIT